MYVTSVVAWYSWVKYIQLDLPTIGNGIIVGIGVPNFKPMARELAAADLSVR